MVVGIEDDELAQPQVTGLRSGLGRDPFLQVAIAGQDVRVVVHDRVTRPIEAHGEGHLGEGHADGVGQALSQGTGGRLDAGGLAVFRMARGTASPLAEPLELLQGQVEARDMKQGVQERTSMSGRENEAVPVGPEGITRVELERAIPERVGHGRRTQRQAGVPGLGLLHGVHGQEAQGIDAEFVQLGRSDGGRGRSDGG